MPSIVTMTFVPSKAAPIVCAPEPEAVRVSAAGAAAGRSVVGAGGGDTPLAVFALGSGVVQSVPVGAVVAPSVCVAGVEATPLPVESHVPVPVTPAIPVDDPAPGPLPGWPDCDDVDGCVPVGSVALVVTGAVRELEASPPVDVEVVLVVTVPVVKPLGKDTELLPDPPTTTVSTGGEFAAVIWSDVPVETVPDCGDVIVNVPDEEICVPVDASVGAGGAGLLSTARERGWWGPAGFAGAASPAGVAGVEGSAGAAGVVAGAAGAAGAGAGGSCTGAPTESDTAGEDWKRSTGVLVRVIPDAVPVKE
jgi:hypothetical protein